MLIKPDCIPCILTMSISAIRKLSLDDMTARGLFSDILKIPGLRGLEWNQASPDIIEIVMKKISAAVNDPDPFHNEKIDLNNRVLKIYPFLKKLVEESSDPLNTAAKISILGNSIDFMMPEGIATIKDFIIKKLDTSLSKDEFTTFQNQLSKIKHLLYFGDNCGEIVFDKLFIKTIKNQYDIEVVYVVRSVPTMNDATLKEAMDVGIDQVATIIENGIDGPLPGTVLKRCSSRVKKLVDQSDLIISKGGGNFDSLGEEANNLKTKITFMLLSKCRPYNKYFNTNLYQPIIANGFSRP
ncbi:MAG: DUF89 family protein [Desulfobacula sp.]|nr:DUF89 family protein [Desulfobacula sp.]